MAALAPADAAWQPPQPGPGELERAFAPLGPAGQAVLRAIDAFPYPVALGNSELYRALGRHKQLEFDRDNSVPYYWQVGRFLRHALDHGNTGAPTLTLMAVASEASNAHTYKDAILMCIQHSLHPDKATALQLFQDIVESQKDKVVRWWTFLTDLIGRVAYRDWGRTRHERATGSARPVHWTEWIQERECLAKVEKCLAIGSPFRLSFDTLHDMSINALNFTLLRVFIYALIQHDSGANLRQVALRFGLATTLREKYGRHADDFDADASATVRRHLDHFLRMRWPPAASHPPQTDVIQLLANHLAHSSIGDANVIPGIMDYVRVAPADDPRAFQQAERQEAHTAIGRAHIARATAQVASAPAAGPSTAPARPRDGEDEAGAAAAPAKRRA